MEPSGPFTSIAMTAATRCAPERATSLPRNRESSEPVPFAGSAKQSAPGLAVLRVLGLFIWAGEAQSLSFPVTGARSLATMSGSTSWVGAILAKFSRGGGEGGTRSWYTIRPLSGWELGVPSTFTIVLPRRAIFCNGLQRVFPQPLNPAPYFEAFTAPFGCGPGRLEVVP